MWTQPTATEMRFGFERVENLQQQLASKGVEMKPVLRDYDRMVWPHASKGFFQLGKRIPEFLAAMNL